jgi:hypothetical protein
MSEKKLQFKKSHYTNTFIVIRMKKQILILYALLVVISASAQKSGQNIFWDTLSSHCGKSFEGTITSEGKNDGFEGKQLVMHVKKCSVNELKIPFFVGEDKSRTWVLTKQEDGILLKHDHRKADGTPEELTMYGGKATNWGTANMQFFPADQETSNMLPRATFNVWWMTVDNTSFSYNLRVVNTERIFTVVFDLTKEVETPEDPWGWEE